MDWMIWFWIRVAAYLAKQKSLKYQYLDKENMQTKDLLVLEVVEVACEMVKQEGMEEVWGMEEGGCQGSNL